MRRLPPLLLAVACLALPASATAAPNVVVIETDDQPSPTWRRCRGRAS